MKLEIVEHYGGEYHIVDLEEPTHVNHDTWYRDEYLDVDEWCEETFGPQDIWGREIVSGWKRMRNRYYFVGEDKLNWFVTRWS
jgi:hypothetical protein